MEFPTLPEDEITVVLFHPYEILVCSESVALLVLPACTSHVLPLLPGNVSFDTKNKLKHDFERETGRTWTQRSADRDGENPIRYKDIWKGELGQICRWDYTNLIYVDEKIYRRHSAQCCWLF